MRGVETVERQRCGCWYSGQEAIAHELQIVAMAPALEIYVNLFCRIQNVVLPIESDGGLSGILTQDQRFMRTLL